MDIRITRKEVGIRKANESRKRIKTLKAAGIPVETESERLAKKPRGAFKRITPES